MMVVGAEMAPFAPRVFGLCYTPYFTDGILAGIGGLMNPIGFFYVIASALPSTLGANAGLLSLPFIMPHWKRDGQGERVGLIARSQWWIAAGAVGSLLFIFVLGRGLTWSR
jgi:hypothetical protein